MPEPTPDREPLRVAQYVRMSTDHQQYSTENQSDQIREYAQRHGMQIVRTYADSGKSGLNIGGRDALQSLIRDVETGVADFQHILVYDISRWGRFQDADESAYYEYICKRRNIHVIYVAEQFDNDGSPVSTIVKGVKRAMAGEYSRELSTKVFTGQCRLIELGFRQGGPAGFGLRRVLIDQAGTTKGELARGEHKSLQTDRVILVPGPPSEVDTVRQIYDWFINQGLPESAVAAKLNSIGVLNDLGRPWSRGTVHEVLTNEKYIGNNVYNRHSFKLKKKHVDNPPQMWIRKEAAFEPIIGAEVFYTAQGIIRGRGHRFSNAELIDQLRRLYQERGYLSGLVINETNGMPSSTVYAHRFGSLLRAYQEVGFTPDRDYRYVEINQMLRQMHPRIVAQTQAAIQELGGTVQRDPTTDLLNINGEFTASLVLSRCTSLDNGSRRWKVRFDTGLAPDITVAVRLNEANDAVLDYYLLPRLDFGRSNPQPLRLAERNPVEFESYRFDTLDYLFGMGERSRMRRAA